MAQLAGALRERVLGVLRGTSSTQEDVALLETGSVRSYELKLHHQYAGVMPTAWRVAHWRALAGAVRAYVLEVAEVRGLAPAQAKEAHLNTLRHLEALDETAYAAAEGDPAAVLGAARRLYADLVLKGPFSEQAVQPGSSKAAARKKARGRGVAGRYKWKGEVLKAYDDFVRENGGIVSEFFKAQTSAAEQLFARVGHLHGGPSLETCGNKLRHDKEKARR
jgi:hypothetical protein